MASVLCRRLGVVILSSALAGGCSTPPPPPAPHVQLSDEEFIKKLAAEQDAKDAQEKAAAASATTRAALRAAEIDAQQAEAWQQASYLTRAIHVITRRPLTFTPPRVTTATFEPIYGATKAVQAATWAAPDFVKYDELLQALATQLSMARDLQPQMNSSDKKVLSAFEDVFAIYQSGRAQWEKLDGQEGTMLQVQALWEKADAKIDRATAMYYSQPVAAPAIPSS